MTPETRIRRIKNINTFPKPLEDHLLFLKENPKIDISRKEHAAIIKSALQLIGGFITSDVTGFKLPRSMGYLAVTKFKPSKRRKDYKSSKQYGKEINYLNLHSFGFIMYVKWFKPHRNFANKRLFSFEACRDIKRDMKDKILNQSKSYEVLDREFYYALVRECLPEWKLDSQRVKFEEKMNRQKKLRTEYNNRNKLK